jgi:hypothetical protein
MSYIENTNEEIGKHFIKKKPDENIPVRWSKLRKSYLYWSRKFITYFIDYVMTLDSVKAKMCCTTRLL